MAYTINTVATTGTSLEYLRDLYNLVNYENDFYDSVVKDETALTLTFSKNGKTLVVYTIPSTLTASSGLKASVYGDSNSVDVAARITTTFPTTVIKGDNGVIISVMYQNNFGSSIAIIFGKTVHNNIFYGARSLISTGISALMSSIDNTAELSTTYTQESKLANVTQLVPMITRSDTEVKEWSKDIYAVIRYENTNFNWSVMTLDGVQYVTNNVIAMKA
jgi:hypothetical protein